MTCERPRNVRDEFSAAAYTNNNGTASWAGSWTETDALAAGRRAASRRSTGGQLQLSRTRNVKDEFTAAAYTNNNGTASWSGSWTETDALGGGAHERPRAGDGGGPAAAEPGAERQGRVHDVAYTNNNGTASWAAAWTETDTYGTGPAGAGTGAAGGFVRVTGGASGGLQFRYLLSTVRDQFTVDGTTPASTGSDDWTGDWTESTDDDESPTPPGGNNAGDIYITGGEPPVRRARPTRLASAGPPTSRPAAASPSASCPRTPGSTTASSSSPSTSWTAPVPSASRRSMGRDGRHLERRSRSPTRSSPCHREHPHRSGSGPPAPGTTSTTR